MGHELTHAFDDQGELSTRRLSHVLGPLTGGDMFTVLE